MESVVIFVPTEKPRVTFTISQDTLDRVDEYRFSSKSKNQSQAILSLLEKGLDEVEANIKKAPPYSGEALKLAKDYDTLDAYGKRQVRVTADLEMERYQARQRIAQLHKREGETVC